MEESRSINWEKGSRTRGIHRIAFELEVLKITENRYLESRQFAERCRNITCHNRNFWMREGALL